MLSKLQGLLSKGKAKSTADDEQEPLIEKLESATADALHTAETVKDKLFGLLRKRWLDLFKNWLCFYLNYVI